MSVLRWIGSALALCLLAGCYPIRDTSHPPALRHLAAPQPPQRLVIVLPGIGDNLQSLDAGGIGTAVRTAWPDADVLLVEMTIGYYKDGRAMPDLKALVNEGRQKGYRQVWLVGASLGGMGALLYDATYPCEVDGIVLLAPYLGDRPIRDRVRDGGGVTHWAAPPAATPGQDNWQEQIWRRAQQWSREAGGNARVWLAYGDSDKFAANMPLLMPAVPASHAIRGPGVHEWTSWTPLAARVFASIKPDALPPLSAGGATGDRCAVP
ncbi:MAG: alpha/beta fold hydrolase [Luteibacter sp.]